MGNSSGVDSGLPGIHCHGDFCTANLLVGEDDRVRVIDWEYPLDAGWPGTDLFYFISSVWCIPRRPGAAARVANYREIFFRRHRHSKRIAREVARYLETFGLAAELALPLMVLSWVGYANRKRRLVTEAGDRAEAEGEIEPLTLLEENRCLNLEVLAEERESFLPG